MSKPWFEKYDPNTPGEDPNLFGLPCNEKSAQAIVIPVPWEATVTYGAGTSNGPNLINNASKHVDLYQSDIFMAWKLGIYLLPVENKIGTLNSSILSNKSLYTDQKGSEFGRNWSDWVKEVNNSSKVLNEFIEEKCLEFLKQDKVVGVLGGEHSSPFGLLAALTKHNKAFAILQIDAHADLREAYEGYEHSHASIMYNALKLPEIKQLVQVGVRDYCDEEAERMEEDERIIPFTYRAISDRLFAGETWAGIVDEIVNQLPEKVYISFDIDGLDPALCPGTGTPVPGGLSFDQADYLIKSIAKSGIRIIGFDLCEVGPGPGEGEWDGNVGARMLYRLTNLTAASQDKIFFN